MISSTSRDRPAKSIRSLRHVSILARDAADEAQEATEALLSEVDLRRRIAALHVGLWGILEDV
jgi:hypothetical protein